MQTSYVNELDLISIRRSSNAPGLFHQRMYTQTMTFSRCEKQRLEEKEKKLYSYRSRCFRLSARVPLHILTFEEGFRSLMNSQENVPRLERLMDTQGCQRLMRENHIPVIVPKEDWLSKVTPVYEEDGVHCDLPLLSVSHSYHLRALDHESLINAAQIILTGKDQWLIADIYVHPETGTRKPHESPIA